MAIITHTLKDGRKSYSAVVRIDGKQVWKRFATWKAADRYRTSLKTQRDEGTYVTLRPAPRGTVFDAWLAHLATRVKEGDLKAESVGTFRSHVDTHLRPALGPLRSDRLRPDDLRQWAAGQADLIVAGRITPVTRNCHLTILRMILKWARGEHYLAHDPLATVKRIKIDRGTRRKKAMVILAPDETAALLAAAPPPHDTILKVLAWTGLRIGECFALRWEDIDRAAQTLHVRRRIYRGRIDTPKTAGSARRVDLPQALVDDLTAYEATQPPPADGYLFGDAHGTVLDVDRWRRVAFRQAVRAAGLDLRVTPHTLRHSYASVLINDPATPMKYVSEQLGHSSIQMTLDVYADILPTTRTGAIQRLDVLIEKTTARPNGSNQTAPGQTVLPTRAGGG